MVTDEINSALTVYDFLLTSRDEVQVFQSKRWNGATVTLLMARYLNLAYWILLWIPVHGEVSIASPFRHES